MPTVVLPDGTEKHYEDTVSLQQVAADIGPGIAKAAIAGQVNGKLVDMSYLIVHDAELKLITDKDVEGLEVIRHSCAHLLAQAVKQLFPSAQVTIGPVIDDGFYYDFSYERPFTLEDMAAIEERMKVLADKKIPVTRKLMRHDEAIKFFLGLGETYKAKIIEDIPAGETLSLYTQGDFTDLCRGPHVSNTAQLKAFKLTKISGAYWRGDSNNEMLQRIYGTAWANKKDLDTYIEQREEAERRDHRKIAKTMDLFHIQEEAPGMIFWHPRGWTLYQTMRQYMRTVLDKHGYEEVNTPVLIDRVLWEKSGHWEKFHEEMFVVNADEERVYALKPMNCPAHVQIYNQKLKSYRDLPLRLSEFGSCHRNEISGALHGLMRVRNLVQDDAHIFCTEEQIQSEVSSFIKLLYEVYKDFGFTELIVNLSTRPEKRVGSEAVWDKAEKALEDALNAANLEWGILPGEGAFYGPKIEFSLKDCIGRVWQCGTMQVDFSMPERLGATYIDDRGEKRHPVMLHRAVLGSFERFMGTLIEHYAGLFPLWLAPVQVVVMNITDKQQDFCEKVAKKLKESGVRVISDLRNEKIGFKIREHTLQKVPYLLVAGDREVESETVAVRTQQGKDLGTMSVEALIAKLSEQINQRSLDLLA